MSLVPTPGPWIVGTGLVADFNAGDLHYAVGQQGDPWIPIALISRADKVSETDRANAALIAAAPDLLVSLIAICEAGRLLSRDDCARIFDNDSVLLQEACAAIAKAEGR